MSRMAEIKRQVKKDWEMQGYQRCLELLEEEYAIRTSMTFLPEGFYQLDGLKMAINILKMSPITADLRRNPCEK